MPVVNYTTVNGRILHEDRGGVKTLFMPDTLGNVIETRNMDTGAQTSSTTYWPYGEVRTQTGTNPSPFGFCGVWGYYTQAGQPTYVRARYYRPNLGRWQTVDPLWPWEDAYRYANLSPLVNTDRLGLFACSGPPNCLDILAGKGVGDGTKDSLKGAFLDCFRLHPTDEVKLRDCIGKASKGSSIPTDVFDKYIGCMIASCRYTEARCGTNVCEFQLDATACCNGMRDACMASCIRGKSSWDIGAGISMCFKSCEKKMAVCLAEGGGREGEDGPSPWP